MNRCSRCRSRPQWRGPDRPNLASGAAWPPMGVDRRPRSSGPAGRCPQRCGGPVQHCPNVRGGTPCPAGRLPRDEVSPRAQRRIDHVEREDRPWWSATRVGCRASISLHLGGRFLLLGGLVTRSGRPGSWSTSAPADTHVHHPVIPAPFSPSFRPPFPSFPRRREPRTRASHGPASFVIPARRGGSRNPKGQPGSDVLYSSRQPSQQQEHP